MVTFFMISFFVVSYDKGFLEIEVGGRHKCKLINFLFLQLLVKIK